MTASCDPLAIWRNWADDVTGQALDSGYFLAREWPAETPAVLRRFHAVTESRGRRRERLRWRSRPSARVPVERPTSGGGCSRRGTAARSPRPRDGSR